MPFDEFLQARAMIHLPAAEFYNYELHLPAPLPARATG